MMELFTRAMISSTTVSAFSRTGKAATHSNETREFNFFMGITGNSLKAEELCQNLRDSSFPDCTACRTCGASGVKRPGAQFEPYAPSHSPLGHIRLKQFSA